MQTVFGSVLLDFSTFTPLYPCLLLKNRTVSFLLQNLKVGVPESVSADLGKYFVHSFCLIQLPNQHHLELVIFILC